MFAYVAADEGKAFVVVGNKPLESHDEVGPLTFSRTGASLAYLVREGQQLELVVTDLR